MRRVNPVVANHSATRRVALLYVRSHIGRRRRRRRRVSTCLPAILIQPTPLSHTHTHAQRPARLRDRQSTASHQLHQPTTDRRVIFVCQKVSTERLPQKLKHRKKFIKSCANITEHVLCRPFFSNIMGIYAGDA